ncbi:MAG: PAS domain S-box protein, partial [Methanoregulaceae archaeon]|nr:PAS domain S-box protein [Methanoregulaceae archaeon]
MAKEIRVLYVDDEPSMLDIGKIFLESGNAFSVDTLTSASAALEHLNTEQYDVIISDYQMPGMNGVMFLKQLKQAGNTTPFIIFTGRGREEVVIEALNEGADFYLQKGGDPRAQFTELANKIRYAVTRRRAEEGLRESEERYRRVVEDQTEFICRFLPDGTHIFVNDAYCRYFGLDREEITGSLFRPTIHPEDRQDVARVFASLTPDHPLDTIDQRILMPDGSLRWQRWVDRAIFGEDGTLKEYQSVGRDITDYKQSEAALRESEAKYRTVFETTGTAMVLIENDATISLVNSEFERLSGFAKEEIENRKKWTEFVVEEDLDRMLDQHHLRRRDRESALAHYEFRFRTRSGDIRNIFLTIDVIPDTAQSIASLLDISDRKMIEEVLRDRLETERALINSPADMAVLLDVHGIILNINDQYAGVLGNTPRNLLGACLWDL